MLTRGETTANSFNYINGYSKSINYDFSGAVFSDLSNTYPYAVTACGLNHLNNNNSTFARLRYNNTYLRSTDFASSPFTIYLKHAARFSNSSPFNSEYPTAATVSNEVVFSGSDFSVNFYSLLDHGTAIPYNFFGCTADDLNGTSITGNVTAPYGTVTKTFTRANYAIFPTVVPQSLTILCVPLPVTTYAVTVNAVTVNGYLFYLDGLRQMPTMTAGNVYKFDQSDSSNLGNTLVFGFTLDSPTIYTTGVFTNGTPGLAGAYTLLNFTDTTPSGLKYYSSQTRGLGYLFSSSGTSSSVINNGEITVTFTSSGSITLYDTVIAGIIVVGGGGSGGNRPQGSNSFGSTGGGGGGIAYNLGITLNYGTTYNIVVGPGGTGGTPAGTSSFGTTMLVGNGGGAGLSAGTQKEGGTAGSATAEVTGSVTISTATGGTYSISPGASTTIYTTPSVSRSFSGGGTSGTKYSDNSLVGNTVNTAVYGTGGNGRNGTSFTGSSATGHPGNAGVVQIIFKIID